MENQYPMINDNKHHVLSSDNIHHVAYNTERLQQEIKSQITSLVNSHIPGNPCQTFVKYSKMSQDVACLGSVKM